MAVKSELRAQPGWRKEAVAKQQEATDGHDYEESAELTSGLRPRGFQSACDRRP